MFLALIFLFSGLFTLLGVLIFELSIDLKNKLNRFICQPIKSYLKRRRALKLAVKQQAYSDLLDVAEHYLTFLYKLNKNDEVLVRFLDALQTRSISYDEKVRQLNHEPFIYSTS